jgi:hypothetical protein
VSLVLDVIKLEEATALALTEDLLTVVFDLAAAGLVAKGLAAVKIGASFTLTGAAFFTGASSQSSSSSLICFLRFFGGALSAFREACKHRHIRMVMQATLWTLAVRIVVLSVKHTHAAYV